MTYINNGFIKVERVHEIAVAMNREQAAVFTEFPEMNTVWGIQNHEGSLIIHSNQEIDLDGWKRLWEYLGEDPYLVQNAVTLWCK